MRGGENLIIITIIIGHQPLHFSLVLFPIFRFFFFFLNKSHLGVSQSKSPALVLGEEGQPFFLVTLLHWYTYSHSAHTHTHFYTYTCAQKLTHTHIRTAWGLVKNPILLLRGEAVSQPSTVEEAQST